MVVAGAKAGSVRFLVQNSLMEVAVLMVGVRGVRAIGFTKKIKLISQHPHSSKSTKNHD